MASETCYVALSFDRCREGCLSPKITRSCADADEARREAQGLSETHAGAVAFSRVIDVEAGTATGVRILCAIGELPDFGYLGAPAGAR